MLALPTTAVKLTFGKECGVVQTIAKSLMPTQLYESRVDFESV